MSANYVCPSCRTYLNVGQHIVFAIELAGNRKGVVLLNSEIGNYKVLMNPMLDIKSGEPSNFYCPACHANLAVKETDKFHFAKVIMMEQDKPESDIYFSEIMGEHCTYKVTNGIVEAFGEDSLKYTNFFGEMPKY